MKVTEIGKIRHENKKNNRSGKPSKSDRKKIKVLRKFKRNNS